MIYLAQEFNIIEMIAGIAGGALIELLKVFDKLL
jgi:hypothetical protein